MGFAEKRGDTDIRGTGSQSPPTRQSAAHYGRLENEPVFGCVSRKRVLHPAEAYVWTTVRKRALVDQCPRAGLEAGGDYV